MSTATGQRYINNRAYPIISLDGSGGKKTIMPGEIVGEEFAPLVDMRKGLIPYTGPRDTGPMQQVGLPSEPRMQSGQSTVPGIMTPRVDGAQPTELIAPGATMPSFQGKNALEWAQEADQKGLASYSRGTLLGIAQYVGIKINPQAAKKDILSVVETTLKAVALAAEVNKKPNAAAEPPTPPVVQTQQQEEEEKSEGGKKRGK